MEAASFATFYGLKTKGQLRSERGLHKGMNIWWSIVHQIKSTTQSFLGL